MPRFAVHLDPPAVIPEADAKHDPAFWVSADSDEVIEAAWPMLVHAHARELLGKRNELDQ